MSHGSTHHLAQLLKQTLGESSLIMLTRSMMFGLLKILLRLSKTANQNKK